MFQEVDTRSSRSIGGDIRSLEASVWQSGAETLDPSVAAVRIGRYSPTEVSEDRGRGRRAKVGGTHDGTAEYSTIQVRTFDARWRRVHRARTAVVD